MPTAAQQRLVVRVKKEALSGFREKARSFAPMLSDNDIRPYFKDERSLGGPDVIDILLVAHQSVNASDLVSRIKEEIPGVVFAYIEGDATMPPTLDVAGQTEQGYLNAAPNGIGVQWTAQFAANWNKSRWYDVDFVDVEQGWLLNHEALKLPSSSIISGVNKRRAHGTAVLGIVVAGKNNPKRIVGIAPQARCKVVSIWEDEQSHSVPNAIRGARESMMKEPEFRGVLLLECQVRRQIDGKECLLPVEVEQLSFDEIKRAVYDGITVVEAAGNGFLESQQGHNLDLLRPPLSHGGPTDPRDSGAILVGAAHAGAQDRKRMDYSNYGERIDCYAWGEKISTCGDYGSPDDPTKYMSSFGGTSGASAIIAGAAIVLLSWARSWGKDYSPREVRSRLSNTKWNTHAAPQEHIGVMPNIEAIFKEENKNIRTQPL